MGRKLLHTSLTTPCSFLQARVYFVRPCGFTFSAQGQASHEQSLAACWCNRCRTSEPKQVGHAAWAIERGLWFRTGPGGDEQGQSAPAAALHAFHESIHVLQHGQLVTRLSQKRRWNLGLVFLHERIHPDSLGSLPWRQSSLGLRPGLQATL